MHDNKKMSIGFNLDSHRANYTQKSHYMQMVDNDLEGSKKISQPQISNSQPEGNPNQEGEPLGKRSTPPKVRQEYPARMNMLGTNAVKASPST